MSANPPVVSSPMFGSSEAAIDFDVHPMLPNGDALREYLPGGWRERLARVDASATSFTGPRYRHSRRPPPGTLSDCGIAGSVPSEVVSDYMKPNGIEAAVLMSPQALQVGAWVDPDESAVWASAFNRYFVDHWLCDRRFGLVMVVAPQDPEQAAAEVRRLTGQPGIVGVCIPWTINIHLGRRYYRPIIESICEVGLPLVTHGSEGAAGGALHGQPDIAGGTWEYEVERYAAQGTGGLAHASLVSLVFTGTFDRYPDLKVVFVESGFAWVGQALWRMDSSWQTNRPYVPWVKQPPSEYVVDHCWFTTGPIPEPESPEYVVERAWQMYADRTLLFGSQYPHWDTKRTPPEVLKSWPDDLRTRVMRENARQLLPSLGW